VARQLQTLGQYTDGTPPGAAPPRWRAGAGAYGRWAAHTDSGGGRHSRWGYRARAGPRRQWAEPRVAVYGCLGCRHTSLAWPISTSLPRYMTPIQSLICPPQLSPAAFSRLLRLLYPWAGPPLQPSCHACPALAQAALRRSSPCSGALRRLLPPRARRVNNPGEACPPAGGAGVLRRVRSRGGGAKMPFEFP